LKWKRLRCSLRDKRDDEQFRADFAELEAWREKLRTGSCEFELWYYDEAGFTLTPSLPYA
jgi:hypothetical protein